MKAAQDDPWSNISETVKEGQSFKGKVMRLESFEAFSKFFLELKV